MYEFLFTFASAYLQGRVKIPIGGIVREPEGTSRWNYGTDSDPADVRPPPVCNRSMSAGREMSQISMGKSG